MILRRKSPIVLRDLAISCYSRSFIELIMEPERDLKSGNMPIIK